MGDKNVKGLFCDNSIVAIVNSILASPVASLPVVSEALLGKDGKNVAGRYTRAEKTDAENDTVRRLALDHNHSLTAGKLLHKVSQAL